jgi:hypothetical protein
MQVPSKIAVAVRHRDLRVRRGRRGDAGFATSAVIVCVAVGIVAILMIAVLPLLSGTDKSTRTQTASDAAALAGATAARDAAVAELDDAVDALDPADLTGTSQSWRLSSSIGPSAGLGSAQDYARRNDAAVETYRANATTDRVAVTARAEHNGPGDRVERTDAVAQVGVRLSTCRIDASREVTGWTQPPTPTPTPTPSPSPSAGPTPTPTPTPPFVSEPIYGPWSFSLSCDGTHAFTVSDSSISALVARGSDELGDLRPRLVS